MVEALQGTPDTTATTFAAKRQLLIAVFEDLPALQHHAAARFEPFAVHLQNVAPAQFEFSFVMLIVLK